MVSKLNLCTGGNVSGDFRARPLTPHHQLCGHSVRTVCMMSKVSSITSELRSRSYRHIPLLADPSLHLAHDRNGDDAATASKSALSPYISHACFDN